MRRAVWLLVLLSLVIGAALLLGACGSTSPATTGAPTSTSAGAAPMTTVSTASTTTTTAASVSTPTTAAQSEAVGTKGNPVPLGTEATVGDWQIKVTSADLDADAAVKNAPGYTPPDPGNQYVLVNLDATYTGQYPDAFGNGLGYQIVGSKGDTFGSTDIGLANSIADSNALVNGASVSGPLVFQVPSDQVDRALLWMAPSSQAEESGVFFALH